MAQRLSFPEALANTGPVGLGASKKRTAPTSGAAGTSKGSQKIVELKRNTLQFASLAQTLVTVNTEYASQATEMQRIALEAKDQKIHLTKMMEAVKSDALGRVIAVEEDKEKMQQEMATVKINFDKMVLNLRQFQEAQAKDKATIELLQQEQVELQAQLNVCRDALDAANVAIKQKDAAIKKAVEESFENAPAKIRLLNHEIHFNTSKMDCMSFMDGDKIVPLFPASDTISESQFEGNQGEDGGEEAQTGDGAPSS